MICVYDPAHIAHDPQTFLSSGALQPCPEKPARVDALLSGLTRLGLATLQPADHGMAPIAAIHPARYLTFLQTIHARWSRIPGASAEVIPNIHPNAFSDGYPLSAVGQAGYHMTDTSCPIGPHTWNAAYAAAQSAIHAADLTLQGHVAYALCRPPGHHAFAERAGGFCYLNNSAIAAQHLRAAGRRPVILDIDLHHGNGTQGIFYARPDVLTISLHAHPERFYPFFWGYEAETGTDEGIGANLNLPLPRGTGDAGFLTALETACTKLTLWGADTLVIALGLDAYVGDPFAGLGVTTPGFAQIGAMLAGLNLPTTLIQEGGYLCPALGENLAAVLRPFA